MEKEKRTKSRDAPKNNILDKSLIQKEYLKQELKLQKEMFDGHELYEKDVLK